MPSEKHYPATHPISIDFKINAGETESEIITVFNSAKIWNVCLKGIVRPSNLNGTYLNILVSLDGTNFYTLHDEDNDPIILSVNSTAGAQRIQADDVAGWPYIKIQSNATEASERNFKALFYIV
jgi:hypothetical protein